MFQRQLCFPSRCFKHPPSYLCLHRLLHFHHKDNYWTDILTLRQLDCPCLSTPVINDNSNDCFLRHKKVMVQEGSRLWIFLPVSSLPLNVQYCAFSCVCVTVGHWGQDCITKSKTVSYRQKSSVRSNQPTTAERRLSCVFIPYMLSEIEQNVQNQPMAKVLFISGNLPVDIDGPLLMEQQPVND